MLIRLRFISLLFILLFSTVAFGQNKYSSMPLYELHDELNYWYNVVNTQDWWFVRNQPGTIARPPAFIHKDEVIKNLFIEKYGHQSLSMYDKNTAHYLIYSIWGLEVKMLHDFSEGIKFEIRKNTIPTIENAIRNHPDNPHNLNNQGTSMFEPIEYNNELDLPELGVQCPKSNPGNKLKNKFYTNNNTHDKTYVLCNYFNDGVLQYQMPYVNGKKEGIYLLFKGKHFNTRVPHPLADLKPYKNGKRHGVGEVWLIDKNSGQHWQLYKTDYTNGQKHGEQIKYYQNGTLHTVSMFNYGKITTSCSYRKDGSLVSCKQY